ncbi:hypothetical protein [Streptomyces cinerochromogenes]|uniref:hypothetical protein n=1 Tax=Streptomyces cinerochromogenes TaxID=66422 RepID=UPI0033AF2919
MTPPSLSGRRGRGRRALPARRSGHTGGELSRDTLRRSRHTPGHEHPLALSCQVAPAAELRAAHEQEEAGKLEEDALLGLTRTLGAQHPHTISARRRVRPSWDFEAYLG